MTPVVTIKRPVSRDDFYRTLGFREIEPYYELPHELREWLVFMERDI